ncbi:aconitate hydratase [Coemansia brasiliensis]|uniref:Aconitate hydratase n=1 Tax=Coemansia brasiliensis TaxID=2650707 RepID=A0A9W8I8V6_9FUNG|nr:aconitate hydratase [Coemansia brasiliensis]
MSSHDSTPKKRRWDASDSTLDKTGAPTDTHPAQSAYVPPPMDASSRKGSAVAEPLTANVDINHSRNRQTLAKGSTHKRIMEATGTEVTTRGRFYANPDGATPAEPPLHLHVEAPTQEALDKAVAMIEHMKNEQVSEPAASVDEVSRSFAGTHFGSDSRRSGSRLNSGSYGRVQNKIFIEIESERGFNVRAKLIGTGGENMKYIQSTTGARVQVRGHGSGFFEGQADASQEPMHLLIIADNDAVMDQAHAYCQSLVDTVHAQYSEFKETGGRRSDRHHRDQYGHGGRYSSWQQQYSQPYDPAYAQNYPQQSYAETHYSQPASHFGAAGSGEQSAADAAAYEEYVNYCAQYYQYYGTYPDYSAYYAQADPSQYAEQHSATATPAADQSASPGTMPAARDEDGYHNVPPPATYSNGHKKR